MDFDQILNTKLVEIERPPLVPAGTYQFSVTAFEQKDVNSANGSWKVIEFSIAGLSAMMVPDQEALAKFGIQNVKSRLSFMFDTTDKVKFDQTMFQLKTFLTKHLGLPESESIRVQLTNSIGKAFLGTVTHRADKNDPSLIYAEVRKTAPL